MNLEQLKQDLQRENTWRDNPSGWMGTDSDLRRVMEEPFEYTPNILANLTEGGLYILHGPRRVGKSVETKRKILELTSSGVDPTCIIHASVEGWDQWDLRLLVDAGEALSPSDAHRWWFIDEIQSVDGWGYGIKWLRDNNYRFGNDTVVLTGSSSAGMREAMGALAGRRGAALEADPVLLPMGFRTFARLVNPRLATLELVPHSLDELAPEQLALLASTLANWQWALVPAWDLYLRVGGFPQAVAEYLQPSERRDTIYGNIRSIVRDDAFRRSRTSETQNNELLRRFCSGLGSPVNKERWAREIDTSPATLGRRLDDLMEAFIIWPAYKESKMFPKLRAQEKLYFSDPIYVALVNGVQVEPSVLSEQQLGMALARSLERKQNGYSRHERVMYHHSSSDTEIDFVGRDFGGFAVESRFVNKGWKVRTVTLARSRWNGIVATRSVLDVSDPALMAIPAGMLAWLIDN